MQNTMKDVGRERDCYDVSSRATLQLPLVLREKISVALLVNVLHYREEEKLDIVESRASVIGCRSMRR